MQLCSELWQLIGGEDNAQPRCTAGLRLGFWVTTQLLLSIRGEVNSIILIHGVSCVSLLHVSSSFTSLSGSKSDTLLQKPFTWHTENRAFPTWKSSDQQNIFALVQGHVTQPVTVTEFSLLLLLPHKCVLVLGSVVMLDSCLKFCLGDLRGMLLSVTSEKTKYLIFPHTSHNGKFLKDIQQASYDLYLLILCLVSVKTNIFHELCLLWNVFQISCMLKNWYLTNLSITLLILLQ